MPSTIQTVLPGDEIQIGAYRLVRQIGAGGMGAVWLARHAMLGRDAALKVLHPSFSARAEIVARFFNEARAASSIADPGIVQIFDFGYHTDGSAYIVMELLDGEPLDDRLRRHGRLPVGDALRIMRQVATSLDAAHARGIIHRDLKPENIFLCRDAEVIGGERAKLLDFGIAKLSRDQDTGVKTQTAAMMGTPTYMSPEQCRGAGEVDQRSDIYALGCVLYALVVGEPPFVAEGMGEIIAAHLREPAPRASVKAPWIPAELDDVIARCLLKNPAERPASGTELARAFEALLARTSVAEAAGAATPSMLRASRTTLSAAIGAVTPARPRPKRRAAIALTAVAVAGACAGFAIVQLRATGEAVAIPAPPVIVVPAKPPEARPSPVPQPEVTPHAQTAPQIVAGLEAFVVWARSHAGAPCPSRSELGDARDAWGRELVVTCTRQPDGQQIGLVSAGPDGVHDTGDDVASWTIDSQIVAGARWIARPIAKKPKPPIAQPPKPPKPADPKPESLCKAPLVERDGVCIFIQR